jgi:hypothetical protein
MSRCVLQRSPKELTMRTSAILPAAAVVAAVLLSSCRIETDTSSQTGPQSRNTTGAAGTISGDSLLALLLPLQNAVYLAPKDLSVRTALVAAAFDSASGSIYSVGKGVANPSAAAGTASAGQSRAAQSDANRWALYNRAWLGGDPRDFGADIAGEITYSNVLLEKPEGDTLCVVIQVPYGSVSVK